jgi:hypothetical protein
MEITIDTLIPIDVAKIKREKINFYDLPSDILSKVYEYDSTFHKYFSSNKFLINLLRTVDKTKATEKCIRNFIDGSVESSNIAWNYIRRSSLSNEFKIFLYPKDICYIKFKILRQDDDSRRIDLYGDDFDGFVCTYKQNLNLLRQLSIFTIRDEDTDYMINPTRCQSSEMRLG